MKNIKIPVEISARHVHLSQKGLDKLFGRGYELTKLKDLSQKGEFAAEEIVSTLLITPPFGKPKGFLNPSLRKGGSLETHYMESIKHGDSLNLRIVGTVRQESQIELALTDAVNLGIEVPLRLSGELKNVKAFLEVHGPRGKAKIKVIVAQRHLHCSEKEAKELKLKNGQKVGVEVLGKRGLVFKNVVVRVSENARLACHLDTDEGNATGLKDGNGTGYLI